MSCNFKRMKTLSRLRVRYYIPDTGDLRKNAQLTLCWKDFRCTIHLFVIGTSSCDEALLPPPPQKVTIYIILLLLSILSVNNV